MNKEQLEILINANIPEEWHNDCFITEDGMIFTPSFNEEDEVIKTGEEVYKEWLEAKDAPVIEEEKPEEKIASLENQVTSLQDELQITNQYVTDLELELFELKTMLTAQ